MGDPRLLQTAQPVVAFDTPELHSLIADMRETMVAVNGAGLAAPQIGVNLQLVIFGSTAINPRYPDRPLIPKTVLLNPVITPIGDTEEFDWEGCLSVPGLRGKCQDGQIFVTRVLMNMASLFDRTVRWLHRVWCKHDVTT
jgi:peptide deformylase